jgi:hypothetical protein
MPVSVVLTILVLVAVIALASREIRAIIHQRESE